MIVLTFVQTNTYKQVNNFELQPFCCIHNVAECVYIRQIQRAMQSGSGGFECQFHFDRVCCCYYCDFSCLVLFDSTSFVYSYCTWCNIKKWYRTNWYFPCYIYLCTHYTENKKKKKKKQYRRKPQPTETTEIEIIFLNGTDTRCCFNYVPVLLIWFYNYAAHKARLHTDSFSHSLQY